MNMTTQLKFTAEELAQVEELKKRYPDTKALTLPVLWMAQEKWGHISRETMEYLAEVLEQPLSHILGVVSFYTMFKTQKVGKHHIEVCTNISCMLRGSDAIVEQLRKRLGIGFGEITEDGQFSLEEVECMGSCGTAPMVSIHEEYYENLTPEQVDSLLAKLK